MNKNEFQQKVINARYDYKRKQREIENCLNSYTRPEKEKGRQRRRGYYV